MGPKLSVTILNPLMMGAWLRPKPSEVINCLDCITTVAAGKYPRL